MITPYQLDIINFIGVLEYAEAPNAFSNVYNVPWSHYGDHYARKFNFYMLLCACACKSINFLFSMQHVAVGTSKGILAVYEVTDLEGEGAKCGAMVEFSAHPPQPGSQDQRFGQLGEQ